MRDDSLLDTVRFETLMNDSSTIKYSNSGRSNRITHKMVTRKSQNISSIETV